MASTRALIKSLPMVALGVLVAFALQPATTRATLAEGNPELFDNFVKLSSTHHGVVGWGKVKLTVPALERVIECMNIGFGAAWNEVSPSVGEGQVLGWSGGTPFASLPSGVKGESREVCKGPFNTVVDEAWETDEPPLSGGKRGEPLSVPWNVELRCGERAGEQTAIARIGLPDGTPPSVGCESEAAELEEITHEEQARTGCDTAPLPAGCIKFTNVEPDTGLEQVFEGTLRARVLNGFGNGLNGSTWVFEGFEKFASGHLHLASAYGTTASVQGQVQLVGFDDSELMQAK